MMTESEPGPRRRGGASEALSEDALLDAVRAEGSILASIREKREIVKETDDKLKAFLGDFVKKFA